MAPNNRQSRDDGKMCHGLVVVIVPFAAILILLVGLAILVKRVSQRRAPRECRRGPGPGAAGAVYELLNEDRRKRSRSSSPSAPR